MIQFIRLAFARAFRRNVFLSLLIIGLLAGFASSQSAMAQLLQQGPKLVGTGNAGQSYQGSAVAVSADGNSAVVGGYNDNNGKGAVWFFARNAGVWSQVGVKIIGSGSSGNFSSQGSAVSMSADGNTAVVGSKGDGGGPGAAYVFAKNQGIWSQQGPKLTGSGAVGNAQQGTSVSIAADGNSFAIGGPNDNNAAGAVWIFTRSGNAWTQLGAKLVGTGSTGNSAQGSSVAMSGDGNTLLSGGLVDNGAVGATWVFARSGGVWSQQGSKLVGSGSVGVAYQGFASSLSFDGNTAAVGGYADDSTKGAVWIYVRNSGTWAQQGAKLTGTGAVGNSGQGYSVSLSGDGNNLIFGGALDNNQFGATWSFARAATVWSQKGAKIVGTGVTGSAAQGLSVSYSADGGTALVGGFGDNNGVGAAWVFTQPAISVSPVTDIATSGVVGGPFSPPSFDYTVHASNGDTNYAVAGVPAWLTPSSLSGTVPAGSTRTLNFTVNATANAMAAGTYGPTLITVTNSTNNVGMASINATLTVGAAGAVSVVSAVLPASRSVQIGTTATAFATIINTSSSVGTNCGLSLGSNIPGSFKFQTTDSATNALTGTSNTPINIPANGVQSFVFAIAPSAAFDPTDVPITAGCSNGTAATSVVGLNTLLFSASISPVADLVALAATASNDGVVNIPGTSGTGAFAVATVNLGITSAVAVTVDTGATALPVELTLCQTNPTTGQCTTPVGPAVVTIVGAGDTPTFAIFAKGAASIPFDPANSRVFVRFKDGYGFTRGATSVAVRTQ